MCLIFQSSEPRDDDGTEAIEECTGSDWDKHQNLMTSFGFKTVSRRIFTAFITSRLTDSAVATAFRNGWATGGWRRFPVPTSRQVNSTQMPTYYGKVAANMYKSRDSSALPTTGTGLGDSAQTRQDASAGSAHDYRLASTAVARSCPQDGNDVRSYATATEKVVMVGEPARSATATAPSDLERHKTTLGQLESAQVKSIIGVTPESSATAKLVAEYASSSRANESRNSEWKAWIMF